MKRMRNGDSSFSSSSESSSAKIVNLSSPSDVTSSSPEVQYSSLDDVNVNEVKESDEESIFLESSEWVKSMNSRLEDIKNQLFSILSSFLYILC
jgi:hypothetical protein